MEEFVEESNSNPIVPNPATIHKMKASKTMITTGILLVFFGKYFTQNVDVWTMAPKNIARAKKKALAFLHSLLALITTGTNKVIQKKVDITAIIAKIKFTCLIFLLANIATMIILYNIISR